MIDPFHFPPIKRMPFSIAQGSVLVANSANTLSALDGGGSSNGVLFYTAASDSLSFATSIDGGSF